MSRRTVVAAIGVAAVAVGGGRGGVTHGFLLGAHGHLTRVNDPHGSGATTLNGINDAGDLVGFYTDAKGSTDGLLVAHGHFRAARPAADHHEPGPGADRPGPDPLLTTP